MANEGGAANTNAQQNDARNVQNSEAYSIIAELEQQNKITPQAAETYRQKFYQLHEILITNYENERLLMQKARQLTKSLSNESLKMEKAQQQQKEHEYKLKALEQRLENVRKETSDIDDRTAALSSEVSKLETEKSELHAEFKLREQTKIEELRPEIERMKEAIAQVKKEQEQQKNDIEKEEKNNSGLLEKIAEKQIKKETVSEEIQKLQDEYEVERDKPNQMAKKYSNQSDGYKHVKEDFEKASEARDKLNDLIQRALKTKGDLDASQNETKNELITIQINCQQKENENKIMQEDMYHVDKEIHNIKQRSEQLHNLNTEQIERKKAYQNELKKLEKDYAEKQAQFKKVDRENNALFNQIRDYKQTINSTQKFLDEKQHDLDKYQITQKNLLEEQHIFVGQLVKKGIEERSMKENIMKLKNDIVNSEKEVQQFQEEENRWTEEIKYLSTIRDKMARTASQAMAQADETKEELKVKNLLILDLTKKQQETELRLNSFFALYEQVKNMRNKYVSQIQNYSQDLAEMRERIKILQNEVEILRNESSEKDRSLIDIKHQVQKTMYLRDSLKADQNKYDFTFRSKQQTIFQKINEGDKLNLIINSLQKEMNNLIYEYEQACESRNYMGIQLIDRNDELCILYEKSNIQENILKNGEQKIREKEERIRMIQLELRERRRQLEVVRKQIPEVPVLAENVIDLKKKLDKEKETVQMLSEQLENPENHPKKRDLKGQGPEADHEALNAKIQVLEERLNNKKESLLEKELVFEEVSNLAEKLRTQALDGRKSTLEIAEKINEYKARTTELSRKMLATVSELSMFQSKALKLQQEKDEKEQVLEHAMTNLERGLPPTEDADREWDRMERNRVRRQSEAEERMQRKMLEQQLPPTGVKTTALPRPNSYMPPEIQIPKPYGMFAPFKPSEPGSQMRHMVKPKQQEIEY